MHTFMFDLWEMRCMGIVMRRRRNKNKKVLTTIFVLLIVLISGYAAISYLGGDLIKDRDHNPVPSDQTKQIDQSTASTNIDNSDDTKHLDPIQEKIKTMSLEEKIGQLVIVGADGYYNNEHSKLFIEKYHVGGFILFKRNIKDSAQMLNLLNSLKESNKVNKNPLFLSIDEEGGRVSRMPEEFLKLPTNKKIGQLNNGDLSYQVGSILGQELKAFGMNMNLAPVLDINSNPKNPVIGDRAFGAEAGIVSSLGVQTMKGIQSQNIIPVVKHFPGHGDTSVDSHIGLPKVNHTIQRLKSFELVPFASAIENNVEVIMIAHILLPKLDADNPASFSKTVISDILRMDMNFDGVVITDDFTMGAIIKNYDIGEAAVKSIQAGSDIVLVCHEFEKQEVVINALQKAARSGDISMERVEQSVYRILMLKEKYSISDEPVDEQLDVESINKQIRKLFK